MKRDRQNSPEHIGAIRRGQLAAKARMDAGEGFIYVAEVRDTDAIKIGFSLDPAGRMRTFGGRMRLLGSFPATWQQEKAFHRAHVALRHPDFDGQEIYRLAHFREAATVSQDAADRIHAALDRVAA